MTYHTSHHAPPRTKLPPLDGKPEGMPNEGDLAMLMKRAAKGERIAVAKRDGTSHQPRAPRGEDIEAKRRAEMSEAESQRLVQFMRENPGSTVHDARKINGKTVQATRNQLYSLSARGLLTATRQRKNAPTTYMVTK